MGIPEARKVYEGTYGIENNRVIKEDEEAADILQEMMGDGDDTAQADFSLDLIDLPTFNIAAIISLGREIATKIRSSYIPSTNLGQLILFYNKTTNQVIDTLYDEHNVLTDDDDITSRRWFFMPTSLAKEFYGKLRNIDQRIVGLKRVQVNIPVSQEEIDRLLDPPLDDMMMPPPAHTDFESVNRWLSNHHNLKPRQYITTAHIIANSPSPVAWKAIFKEAFYASELEGFILLYAHRMLKVLRRVLKASTNKSGRYTVLFLDGQAPAIKKMMRLKRKKKQQNTEMKKKKVAASVPNAATGVLFYSCERLALKIPSSLMTCALLDILRIPLVKTIGAKGLYLSLSSFSEAEDDIVRMISCLLDLETPIKHFSLSERKSFVEYDTYSSDGGKRNSKWVEIISTIKQHTNAEHQKVSVSLFSHDSDVLAKWNFIAAHHNQVCKLLRISSQDAAPLSLESCRFFRSMIGPPPNRNNNLGGLAFERHAAPRTVYDLSESPVFLTPESTLLIMLTKGSDYNTPLVSDSTYDVQIRSEVAMFESLSCTCVSGWLRFFETVSQQNTVSRLQCGNVSRSNMSKDPCGVCGKYLVMPFWSTKFFFAAQALGFIGQLKHLCQPPTELTGETNKHDIHRALAINAASNIMAYLTMGSFNQRIFGSISNKILINPETAEKNATAMDNHKETDLSPAVYNSRREFFNNHTVGGIPFVTDLLRSHKQQLFGNIFPVSSHIKEVLDYETLFGEKEEINNPGRIFSSELKEKDASMMCDSNNSGASILSKLSSMLLSSRDNPMLKMSSVPYSIKTMNLLIIVYMNICGLEDSLITSTQLTPLIHEEYCSVQGFSRHTDRANFTAAILEFILIHYKSEISPGSKIKQEERKILNKRIEEIETRMAVCTKNCERLFRETSATSKSVWIPENGYFMPVLGLAASKSWTPLALWSSLIFSIRKK